MGFRYYLYVSDSKVDMLLPQIDPSFGQKKTREFGIDAKVASYRDVTESTPNDDRISRLDRVVSHLEKHGELGSVDEPGTFFREQLAMRWNVLTDSDGTSLAYFGGRTDSGVVVGLGGSTHHVLGASPDAGGTPTLARSLLPSLLDGLRVDPEIDSLVNGDPGHRATPEAAALNAVRRTVEALQGPAQTMEFVAKRLLHGPSPDPEDRSIVLLGSPLYVATVD
ncbi:hypothetical protein GCM10010222_32950 [Streptomyces tanashiensis]|uniref:DUF7019 family protein n=1 Tax=Streptomyces tanashiensis TaxID=67367 RepID=UPI0016785F2F|nr:SAVMC3_10250 family protein [Streptomyces tanashiensis]GGS88894.1 hypothetical protein GCM10010222_32950 [Streptomyces tanashiensis]